MPMLEVAALPCTAPTHELVGPLVGGASIAKRLALDNADTTGIHTLFFSQAFLSFVFGSNLALDKPTATSDRPRPARHHALAVLATTATTGLGLPCTMAICSTFAAATASARILHTSH